jgi:hypothetical protein
MSTSKAWRSSPTAANDNEMDEMASDEEQRWQRLELIDEVLWARRETNVWVS